MQNNYATKLRNLYCFDSTIMRIFASKLFKDMQSADNQQSYIVAKSLPVTFYFST